MSLEKNLHEVKDRLAKDQNLLVSAFRLEAFYKKYKVFIFLFLLIIVAFGVYKAITLQQENNKRMQSNELMGKLHSAALSETERKNFEQELAKINPVLFDFYQYTRLQNLNVLQLQENENLEILAGLRDSKNAIIATLANYQYATLTQDLTALEGFSKEVSPILRDRARFQAAYLYIQNGNTAKANEILDSIKLNGGDNQVIYQMASFLKHYNLTRVQENTEVQTTKQ